MSRQTMRMAMLDEDFNIVWVDIPNPWFTGDKEEDVSNNAFEQQSIPEVDAVTVDPERERKIGEYNNRIAALRAMNLHTTADQVQRRLDKLLQGQREPKEG